MEQIKLKASLREGVGKQQVKKMRNTGLVPAVLYHRGEAPISLVVPDKEITKIVHGSGGENILINLTIEKDKSSKPRSVIIKEVQRHPIKRSVLHIDFNEISLTEKIIVEVEVVAKGEPIGVKQDGGFLDHPLRVLKIQCLPTDIPKHIEVDVAGLRLNDGIHVSDLKLPAGIKVLNEPDLLLFQVKIHEEKKEEELPPGEAPELEVLREKKETPEEAAKAAKEEPKKEAAPKAEKK
jgi:large subunit ribosomal protein L25